nr:MAG TPA: hypothetical protein [Caudoviricetes sp.]
MQYSEIKDSGISFLMELRHKLNIDIYFIPP